MRSAALLGPLLVLAPHVRGASTEGRKVKHTRGDSYSDLDDCLKDKRCWKLIEYGWRQIYSTALSEVEAALPGRFFPGALAFAMDRADADGHFLKMTCDKSGSRGPCDNERDILEERIVKMSLLKALPIEHPPSGLYDETNWEILPRGQEYLAKVKKRYPDIYLRLARMVRDYKGREPDKRKGALSEP